VPFAAVLMLILGLGGCASYSPDGGFAPVQQAASRHLSATAAWPRSDDERAMLDRRVAELLAQPLSAADTVQVALFNNRGLRAAYQELGIADAELVQAGRLHNPGFVFARKRQDSSVETERLLTFNLAQLIAMPLTLKLETRRFEATQRIVTQQMLSLAADTRKAYYSALAADQSLVYLRQVLQAAEASAELARRMAQVGNWNKLRAAREQGFYAEAALNLARAEQAHTAARERLTRLMGLWGKQTEFVLAERLPELPAAPEELPDVEQTAMAQRLDVMAARLATEQLAANLGLTRITRFVNVLEVGAIYNTFNDANRERGYEIAFELPLFDWGDAKLARAEAIYMQALDRAAEIAIDARSEVRLAYLNYRSMFDISRHYREHIVPNAKLISEENLLRYNAMQIGVFELLADTRMQIASVNASIQALRDFWIARADLDMALIGKAGLSAMPMAAMGGGGGGGGGSGAAEH
jgi:outer membrane protein TolC